MVADVLKRPLQTSPPLVWFCGLWLAGVAGWWPLAAQDPAAAGAAIVLPNKLVAGQPATLAVLDAEGRLAAGVPVEFSGGERFITDATGRAIFTAPRQPGVLLARLPSTPTGPERGSSSASATVIAPSPRTDEGVHVDEIPRVISMHDRFTVSGSWFRGEADANRAFLGDRPALVLAASPVALVIAPGSEVAPGPTQLAIQVDGQSPRPVPVTLVALELAWEKKQLKPKEKGKLFVRIRGTQQRLEVEARNLTPEVVKLRRGDVQRLITTGGPHNLAAIEMEGRHAGDFSVSVRLVPVAAGLPDTEAARQRLLAARRVAPAGWDERVDQLIRRIEHNPQDALKIRNELERMLSEKPPGEFGQLLEAAWHVLLKR